MHQRGSETLDAKSLTAFLLRKLLDARQIVVALGYVTAHQIAVVIIDVDEVGVVQVVKLEQAGLFGANLEEDAQRLDQVLLHIVAIMGHQCGRQQGARAEASLLQLLCLLDRYDRVSLPMQDEGRTRNLMHLAEIIERLRD